MAVRIEVTARTELRFDSGAPVRSASAIAPLADGWLIAQDDATHAAWHRAGSTTAVRAFPAVRGHDAFSSATGTKQFKPDVEAAVAIGRDSVLLLGSGSSPARTRASLVRVDGGSFSFLVADLTAVYATAARALGIETEQLNLEGACLLGGQLRWFQRGNLTAGVASASVDVDLVALLAAVRGRIDAGVVPVGNALSYHLGDVRHVGDLGDVRQIRLAVTDAVALPDGRILLSAAAEDTPNAYDDGPVVGAALALLEADTVVSVAALPLDGAVVAKVEGLTVRTVHPDGIELIAVVDADDPDRASTQLLLRVWW